MSKVLIGETAIIHLSETTWYVGIALSSTKVVDFITMHRNDHNNLVGIIPMRDVPHYLDVDAGVFPCYKTPIEHATLEEFISTFEHYQMIMNAKTLAIDAKRYEAHEKGTGLEQSAELAGPLMGLGLKEEIPTPGSEVLQEDLFPEEQVGDIMPEEVKPEVPTTVVEEVKPVKKTTKPKKTS